MNIIYIIYRQSLISCKQCSKTHIYRYIYIHFFVFFSWHQLEIFWDLPKKSGRTPCHCALKTLPFFHLLRQACDQEKGTEWHSGRCIVSGEKRSPDTCLCRTGHPRWPRGCFLGEGKNYKQWTGHKMEIDLIQYVRVYAHYIVHILCIYIMIVIICSDYLVLSRTPTVRRYS